MTMRNTRRLTVMVRAAVLAAAAGGLWGVGGRALAQTPTLIDINPYALSTADSNPGNLARLGSNVIFAANDGVNGVELWITDGTTGGTMLLKDINPGAGSSNPDDFINFGSRLIFNANDGANGVELWITDGTTAGTTLIRDIRAGITSTSFATGGGVIGSFGTPNSFVVLGVNDGLTGSELWVTDGTSAGTVQILDIRPGATGSNPSGFFTTGGRVYFLANDGGAFGNELWSTDGTLANTTRLTDIAPGSASSAYSIDAVLGNWGYGVANDLAVGNDQEPTAINLTTLEVRRLADVRPGTTSSSSQEFLVLGTDVFFRGSATGTDTQLYKVTFDGMGDPSGVTLVTDINAGGNDNVGNLAAFNGRVYFAASDGADGRELWSSDGTAMGTTQVMDINPGPADSSPLAPFVVGSSLFFTATTPGAGRELFATDGTMMGTQLLADLRAGAANGLITAPPYAELDGDLLFGALGTTTGNELYSTNGTPAGTGLVKDIRPQTTNSASAPQSMTAVGNRVYFTATDEAGGREVWTSDGSAAGTVRTADVFAGSSNANPFMLTPFGSDLLFAANNGTGTGQTGIEYYRATGTSATIIGDINPGTGSGAPGAGTIGVLGSTAYFSGNDGVSGAEVWMYDGVSAPTRLADFVAGSSGLSPNNFAGINGFVYFSGTTSGTGSTGNEPYRTDGTTITLIEDFNTGTSSSSPTGFFGFGGRVFMRATPASLGSELAVFDPAIPDMYLVQDIRTGSSSSTPSNFVNFNGTLYFTATDTGGNIQLYTANEMTGSAVVKSSAIGSTVTRLVRSGNSLFFSAGNLVGTNNELWAFDGIQNGGNAFPIEINTTAGSFPTDLTDVNGVLYFAAVGNSGGNELHRVTFDGMGVPNGAELVADLNPAGSSTPRNFAFAGNRLFFSADNGVNGEELYVLDFNVASGACCVGTVCSVGPQSGCTGAFQGSGTACGPMGNPTTCCPANFNGAGGVTVQDIFDFLGAFFASSPSADFNGVGGVTVQDIFDYLAAYFTGC